MNDEWVKQALMVLEALAYASSDDRATALKVEIPEFSEGVDYPCSWAHEVAMRLLKEAGE